MEESRFTATLVREGDWIVAQCCEIDVASQGETKEQALTNLQEALELHLDASVERPTCQK